MLRSRTAGGANEVCDPLAWWDIVCLKSRPQATKMRLGFAVAAPTIIPRVWMFCSVKANASGREKKAVLTTDRFSFINASPAEFVKSNFVASFSRSVGA